jgi:NTE family protein
MLQRAVTQTVRDFRDMRTGRYVKLVDGGITDNYGLTSIKQSRVLLGTPIGPMTEHDAIKILRMLFVVVDAGQVRAGDWNHWVPGPGGVELATAAIDAAISTNVRMSFDSFSAMLKDWQEQVVRFRCRLPSSKIAAIRVEHPTWRCDDVIFSVTRVAFEDLGPERAARLSAIPTRLSLPAADIRELIEAGSETTTKNLMIQAFGAGKNLLARYSRVR